MTQCSGEPTPKPAGSAETFTVTGLSPITTYYFALKTADEVPNWSVLSNVDSKQTQATADATPPAAVSDLAATTATSNLVTLTWTAAGDDGNTGTASTYDIRYSTSAITDANWGSATQCSGEPTPNVAGSAETLNVTGLSPNTLYYFAMKTADEVFNWSGLSNVVSKKTEAAADTTPPTTPSVADGGSYTTSTASLQATWGSTDTESGIAEYEYAIGTSAGGTDVAGWTSAGTATGVTRSGLTLTIGTTYYLSVKAKNGSGLWSEVGTSDGIVVAAVTIDMSSGWDSKQLFCPVYYRPKETPGTVVLGVHNKRDMYYLVKVYTKHPGQASWQQYQPREWYAGDLYLPYLFPWSERTFSYAPVPGEEIKYEVWNDLNDENLRDLYYLDFAARSLLGVSISPQVTNPQEFFATLLTFYNKYLQVGGLLGSGQYEQAVVQLARAFSEPLAFDALYHILANVGVQISAASAITKIAGVSFYFLVNVPVWWDFYWNLNRDPVWEDVVFTAGMRTSQGTPDIRVTSSLRIVESAPYYPGETITALFTVTNRGTNTIILNVLTAGGRGPRGSTDVRDFSFNTGVVLAPNASYNYQGKLKLLDSGTYHFFTTYQSSDGQWNTNLSTEGTATNTVDLDVSPVPDKWLAVKLGSPGELRVYDSEGRVTGLVSSEVKNEIPHSMCYGDVVVILNSSDSYNYEVVGTGEGSYSLAVINADGDQTQTFSAADISTDANVAHLYAVNWDAMAQGKKGVTLEIDSNGDGKFEKRVTADTDLTQDELDSAMHQGGLPIWIWIIVGVGAVAIIAGGVLVRRHTVKKPVAAG